MPQRDDRADARPTARLIRPHCHLIEPGLLLRVGGGRRSVPRVGCRGSRTSPQATPLSGKPFQRLENSMLSRLTRLLSGAKSLTLGLRTRAPESGAVLTSDQQSETPRSQSDRNSRTRMAARLLAGAAALASLGIAAAGVYGLDRVTCRLFQDHRLVEGGSVG